MSAWVPVCSVVPVLQGNQFQCATGWTYRDLDVTNTNIPPDAVNALALVLLVVFGLGFFFRVLVQTVNLRRM